MAVVSQTHGGHGRMGLLPGKPRAVRNFATAQFVCLEVAGAPQTRAIGCSERLATSCQNRENESELAKYVA